MRNAELLELIAKGENSGVAFKQDNIRPEQLAKKFVAMAKFQGGNDKTHPLILPFYEEINLDADKIVVVISLQ